MKALCITKGSMFGPPEAHWNIQFMETYEVIEEIEHPLYGKYLVLAHDPKVGYAIEHFVLLPDEQEIEADALDREMAEIVEALNV